MRIAGNAAIVAAELNRWDYRQWLLAMSPLNALCQRGHQLEDNGGWMYCTNLGCSYKYRKDGKGKPVRKAGKGDQGGGKKK